MSCLPDTGSSQTLISADVAEIAGLDVNKNTSTQLYTANGGRMSILGESDIILKSDAHSTKTRALVSSEMKHTVLVSWHDLMRLKTIPEEFPAIAAAVRTDF